jgi:ABC-2 type transport system ATP-binding protein
LAHQPALIFLDEPTTGLDVISARNLRSTIAGLRDEGVTVFLTTHYLEEAERLCDRIALLVEGRIVALDTVEGLRAQAHQSGTIIEVTLAGDDRRDLSPGQEGQAGFEVRRFAGDDVEATIARALAEAKAEGRHVTAVNTVQPTLEDVFVQLTGLSADSMRSEKNGKGA